MRQGAAPPRRGQIAPETAAPRVAELPPIPTEQQ